MHFGTETSGFNNEGGLNTEGGLNSERIFLISSGLNSEHYCNSHYVTTRSLSMKIISVIMFCKLGKEKKIIKKTKN